MCTVVYDKFCVKVLEKASIDHPCATCFVHVSLFCAFMSTACFSGLRTLCISMAEISQEEYNRWSDIYYKASTSLDNRDEKVDEAAELIEKVGWSML